MKIGKGQLWSDNTSRFRVYGVGWYFPLGWANRQFACIPNKPEKRWESDFANTNDKTPVHLLRFTLSDWPIFVDRFLLTEICLKTLCPVLGLRDSFELFRSILAHILETNLYVSSILVHDFYIYVLFLVENLFDFSNEISFCSKFCLLYK